MTTLFDGLLREALGGGGGAGVAFGTVVRESLVSAAAAPSSQTEFAGLVREVLVLTVPPFGPIPIFPHTGVVPIFPPLPAGFPIKVSPLMDTTVGTVKSLREMRVPNRVFPLWDIEILFEELRDKTQNQQPYVPFAAYTQYEQLVEYWLMMYGQTNVFAFDCFWDNSRLNQPIGTGDGVASAFTIYRTWSAGAAGTGVKNIAPVGAVNTVFEVRLDNVVVDPTLYYTSGNTIFFIDATGAPSPPGVGVVISMTFSFYYLCRFVEDEQDFEEFSLNRWTVRSLKFRAVNWVFQ